MSRRQFWIIDAAGLVFALIFGVRQVVAVEHGSRAGKEIADMSENDRMWRKPTIRMCKL